MESPRCPTCGQALTYIGFGALRCPENHLWDQDDPGLDDQDQEESEDD